MSWENFRALEWQKLEGHSPLVIGIIWSIGRDVVMRGVVDSSKSSIRHVLLITSVGDASIVQEIEERSDVFRDVVEGVICKPKEFSIN